MKHKKTSLIIVGFPLIIMGFITNFSFGQNILKNNNFNMQNAILNNKGEWMISPSETSGATDFNFLLGTHTVHHKN